MDEATVHMHPMTVKPAYSSAFNSLDKGKCPTHRHRAVDEQATREEAGERDDQFVRR